MRTGVVKYKLKCLDLRKIQKYIIVEVYNMKAAMKNKIISEINDIPDSKASSLLNYIRFLKYEDEFRTPNAVTERTFRDTDKGKNINAHKSLDDYFKIMES